MTPPKYIVPGQVVLATRRCGERRFFLLPDTRLTQAFGFLVAHYAERFFIGVHAVKVLGNHWHILLTDFMGLRSKFLQAVHSGMARVVNDRMRRRGRVWDNQEPSDVVLCDPETMLEKVLYVSTNAVRHGIVRKREEWTGLNLGPESWGKPQTFRRPALFKNLPETATLKTRPPAQVVDLARADGAETYDAIRQWASQKADERQAELVERREAEGKGFLSMLRVARMKRSDAPTSPDRRGGTRPRYAARDERRRQLARQRIRTFRKRYRRARKAWLAGDDQVIFPKGTYWFKHFSPLETARDGTYGTMPPP